MRALLSEEEKSGWSTQRGRRGKGGDKGKSSSSSSDMSVFVDDVLEGFAVRRREEHAQSAAFVQQLRQLHQAPRPRERAGAFAHPSGRRLAAIRQEKSPVLLTPWGHMGTKYLNSQRKSMLLLVPWWGPCTPTAQIRTEPRWLCWFPWGPMGPQIKNFTRKLQYQCKLYRSTP